MVTLEDTEKEKQKVDTENPADNIYRIPIHLVSFLRCLGDETIKGIQESRTLAEGDTPEQARESLRSYPGCEENWYQLTQEQRKRIPPAVQMLYMYLHLQ